MINLNDLRWAAGFLEGEGYFHGAGHKRTSPVVTAAQKDPECLYRLQTIFSAGSVREYEHKGKTSTYWTYSLCGLQAIQIAMTLFILMSSKRQREIKEMIMKWKTSKLAGTYNKISGHCPKGHPYSEENSYIGPDSYPQCRICRRYNSKEGSRKRRTKIKNALSI